MSDISNRIKLKLKEKGLRQLDLANATGVSTAAVNKWINGNTKNLKSENLIAISKYLGVSIQWLVSGKHESDIISLPFKKITVEDLNLLPSEALQDIEDFILIKLSRLNLKD
ncbi:MAG: helix-turn-helix transcriptional regulator [Crenarchaeota archaeon]|jgi:transcriptional regulator with XRE-family HTH domain|nr:helix-turn-helix transcriptional regulator [Thermoproteota archaeon]